MTRLYVPIARADVAALDDEGFDAPAAFAVTPTLRALVADGDEELFEHLACQLAAAASSSSPIAVAALDVPDARVAPVKQPGAVRVDGRIVARDVACFLVADAGAGFDEDSDLELSWYDRSERALVLDLL